MDYPSNAVILASNSKIVFTIPTLPPVSIRIFSPLMVTTLFSSVIASSFSYAATYALPAVTAFVYTVFDRLDSEYQSLAA